MGKGRKTWAHGPASVVLAASVALGGLVVGGTAASAEEPPIAGPSDAAERPDPSTIPYVGWRLHPTREGVFVTSVAPGGPADDAGIQARDEVLAINDVRLNHRGALREAFDGVEPGDTIRVTIERDGREKTVRVVTGSQADRPGPEERPYLGVYLDRPSTDGLTVSGVIAGSPAESAGLAAGDLIVAVNGTSLADGGLREVIGTLSPGDTITLTVERGGSTVTLTATLGSQTENPDPIRDRGSDRPHRGDRPDRPGPGPEGDGGPAEAPVA